jgi:hypothetical protein
MLSHGQKRDQLPKIDRAFSILGLWHRGFAAGGSLRPFRLPPFVTVLDGRTIAECRVLDERKPPLLARSPGVTVTAIRLTQSSRQGKQRS